MSTETILEKTTWKLDPAHSEVGFAVKHLMITTVRGRFAGVDGSVVIDEEHPERSRVEVAIDAATIDTRNEDRDKHLRSPDFLDVENHPRILFRSTRIDGTFSNEGDSFRVIGDLTIRGVTREATLDVTFDGRNVDPWGGDRIGFTAETRIDRRDFGLTWNQTLETGGLLVANEVTISLAVQAVLESEAEKVA